MKTTKEPKEQPGYSPIYTTVTLKMAMEKRIQRSKETHMALIDLEKTFYSVGIS